MRARRAPPRRAQRAVAQQPLEQRRVAGVVDLAREVLEEAVELVEVAVGDGQEGRRVGSLGARDLAQLELQLVAEPLHAPAHAHEIAALEAAGEQVGVAERARLDRAAAVAQLEREIGHAGARLQAVLARAGEHRVDLVAGAQAGDGGRVGDRHGPDDGPRPGRPFATVDRCSRCAGNADPTASGPRPWYARSRAGTTRARPRPRRRRSWAPASTRRASPRSTPRSSSTSRPRGRRSSSSRAARARSSGPSGRSTRRACRAPRATW